jgi:ABC-type nitrate/sulfonate/bicarbonate transport system substrate-binding protein
VSLVARTATIAALTAAVAACGSSSSKSVSSSTTAVAGSAPAASPAGAALNVGDQQQLIQTLFKASGVENGLAYKVHFIQFGSGPLVNAGFAANRIDVGFMGDLPAALAVQSGLSVKATAAEKSVNPVEFLIAKPGITSISQLKGKQVAYTTGTAQQAFALRALGTAGLKQQDVHQVNVALQQLFTVLETGQVDASVVYSAQQERLYLQQHPDAKVLASNTTVNPPTYSYVLAATAALGTPAKQAAIQDFLKRLIESTAWAATHQSQYATAYLVDVQHETPAEARVGVSTLIDNWVPITPDVQSALQNVIDLEADAGAIKQSFSVAPLFDPTVSAAYNQVVQEVPQHA